MAESMCAFVCGIPESAHRTEEHPFEAAARAETVICYEPIVLDDHVGHNLTVDEDGESGEPSLWCHTCLDTLRTAAASRAEGPRLTVDQLAKALIAVNDLDIGLPDGWWRALAADALAALAPDAPLEPGE